MLATLLKARNVCLVTLDSHCERNRQQTNFTAERKLRTQARFEFVGHVNSHQLNRRIGGAVLPGLVAFFETADLVDHPGSHAVSGTSISRS